jgi:hypothetical protein
VLTLSAQPRAAGRARRWVDQLDGRAHPETLAKVRVLLTEMVTTAMHGGDAQEVRLRLAAVDGVIRGEVSIRGGELERPRGFALLLARRVATRWGLNDGVLWFEVEDR